MLGPVLGSTLVRRRLVVALLGVLPLPGCYEGFDPLDPEILAEIIRSRGDAAGIDHSGLYQGSFEVLTCGCEVEDTTFDITLCTVLHDLEGTGFASLFEVMIIQADGSVRLSDQSAALEAGLGEPLLPTFYGSLDADGTLHAAGILQTDALLVQGQVLSRLDGTLDEEGLRVELQQRYRLTTDVVTSIDGEIELRDIDCRESIEIDLVYIGPPPEPLPPED